MNIGFRCVKNVIRDEEARADAFIAGNERNRHLESEPENSRSGDVRMGDIWKNCVGLVDARGGVGIGSRNGALRDFLRSDHGLR